MAKTLTAEQIKKLKEPLPAEAIKPHPTKTYLSSIKAIYVVERLNEVFGLGGWTAKNEVVKEDGKWVVVKSTFEAPEYGITIPDIFGGNDNADLGDAYKGACTDALTKIGSYLYIGMDVYKGLSENKNGKAVSSYNRDKIETNGKPLITNLLFSKLIDRVKIDGQSAIDKAKEIYSFESSQLTKLQNLLLKEV